MTLLFDDEQPWIKRDNDGKFDVAMGSYDGAEACEAVVCYLLSKLEKKLGKKVSVGCYRDDGLAVCHGTAREVENYKKAICKIFRDNGLQITIESNKKVIDYLDVTLDLSRNTYSPYMKPGNKPIYINVHSNHPPSVIKAVPHGINKRLVEISANEEEFNKAKPIYQEALRNSGYKHVLKYDQPKAPNTSGNRKKRRTRNILWFNPPFNIKVKTNIGHEFIKILDESFPIGSPLRKIFNKNNVKLSYSCLPNIQAKLSAHNKAILKPQEERKQTGCNCRKSGTCPLDGNCKQQTNVVYQAKVIQKANDGDNRTKEQTYVGLASEMKARIANHEQTFRNRSQRNATELSKHIWKLRDAGKDYNIKWKIIGRAKPYSNTNKRCNLCLLEKWFIVCKREMATLNKKNELVSYCLHRDKFLVKNN